MATNRWHTRAACKGVTLDLFFSENSDTRAYKTARAFCAACPVRLACLEEAIKVRDMYGMRGGLSPNERKAFAKSLRKDPRSAHRQEMILLAVDHRRAGGKAQTFAHKHAVSLSTANHYMGLAKQVIAAEKLTKREAAA